MREALLAYLKADAGVTAALGTRLSWGWRRQGSPLPAATLLKVDGQDDPVMDGVSGLVESHVQVDCWGTLAADSTAAASAIKTAVRAIRPGNTGGVIQGAFVERESDTFEGESPDRINRTMLTLTVWHSEV